MNRVIKEEPNQPSQHNATTGSVSNWSRQLGVADQKSLGKAMSMLWKALTQKRELSEKGRKRTLILHATYSLTLAVAASSFGTMALLKGRDIWSGIFLLSVGIAFFFSFSLWVRSIKAAREGSS
jgi:hypothetical protein